LFFSGEILCGKNFAPEKAHFAESFFAEFEPFLRGVARGRWNEALTRP